MTDYLKYERFINKSATISKRKRGGREFLEFVDLPVLDKILDGPNLPFLLSEEKANYHFPFGLCMLKLGAGN